VTWVQEQPRRAVALGLVCFVVVLAAVGIGGALAGGVGTRSSPGSLGIANAAVRRELVVVRRRATKGSRLVALQSSRVRFWRTRAKRATKQLRRRR
jgi:hypothetical protein